MKNIWTNGCFDILHIGHISLFEYAKSLGDNLCVGLDSDTRVRTLKGNNRPINNENYRKKLLESIKYIDEVFIFNNENDLFTLLKKQNIDIIVVGDDYKNKHVLGSDLVKRVEFFNKIPLISTSNIFNRI